MIIMANTMSVRFVSLKFGLRDEIRDGQEFWMIIWRVSLAVGNTNWCSEAKIFFDVASANTWLTTMSDEQKH